MTRTIDKAVSLLPKGRATQLPAPRYTGGNTSTNVGLAVHTQRNHTSDEGHQLMTGLEHAGYELFGHGFGQTVGAFQDFKGCTDVGMICHVRNSKTMVVQDQVEWDPAIGDFRDQSARFTNLRDVGPRTDIFKVLVRKDAHSYVKESINAAQEMATHAWIVYYNSKVVCHLAGFMRPQHVIRTYHTVDKDVVPAYTAEGRSGCLLSGATGRAYPFRNWLFERWRQLPQVNALGHPGFQRQKCYTPQYLQLLSQHKVAICTSSIYSYTLRKIIEATAAGCIVVTDLAEDEVLPEIDGNLVRVDPGPHIDPNVPQHRSTEKDVTIEDMSDLLNRLYAEYDPDKQEYFARLALARYDFRVEGLRLAERIEKARLEYNS